MTAANETGLAAFEQEPAHGLECEPRLVGELARRRRIEEIGPLAESGAVLLDVSLERMRGARAVPDRGASVHAADHEGQPVDDPVRDAPAIGDMIERGVLVESPHVDSPFDGFPVTPDRKGLALSDNRKRGQINVRRQRPVHCDFRFASLAPLIERREIHERERHRPLELVNVRARKK